MTNTCKRRIYKQQSHRCSPIWEKVRLSRWV